MRRLHAQIQQNFSYRYEGPLNDQLMVGSSAWMRIIGLWNKLSGRALEPRAGISDELRASRDEKV